MPMRRQIRIWDRMRGIVDIRDISWPLWEVEYGRMQYVQAKGQVGGEVGDNRREFVSWC